MSREDIPNVLIRLTNVTGFDHTQDSNLAFKSATDEIERLLADEREKVREMCAEYLEKEAAKCAGFAEIEAGERRAAGNRAESWYQDSADAIRQLDLTKPENDDEVSFVCTHCNNAGPLSDCLGKQYERITGPRCPRCNYCVQVLRKPKPTAPSST